MLRADIWIIVRESEAVRRSVLSRRWVDDGARASGRRTQIALRRTAQLRGR